VARVDEHANWDDFATALDVAPAFLAGLGNANPFLIVPGYVLEGLSATVGAIESDG
jgi:hypothetical protein